MDSSDVTLRDTEGKRRRRLVVIALVLAPLAVALMTLSSPVGGFGPSDTVAMVTTTSDGATDATGPAGPAGTDGPAGPAGADGATGPAGPAGSFVQQYGIGATGPAGGKIFYVSPGGFSCGTDNATICHYLEAWTADLQKSDNSDGFASLIMWSGTTSSTVGTGLRIGAGAANTARAVAQDATAERAITLAHSFSNTVSGVVYDDWFLPSRDELEAMLFLGTTIGGLENDWYWSSSENGFDKAWSVSSAYGIEGGLSKASSPGYRVRPVRAF